MPNENKNIFDNAADAIGDAANLNDAQIRLVRLGLIVGTVYVAARYLRGLLKK